MPMFVAFLLTLILAHVNGDRSLPRFHPKRVPLVESVKYGKGVVSLRGGYSADTDDGVVIVDGRITFGNDNDDIPDEVTPPPVTAPIDPVPEKKLPRKCSFTFQGSKPGDGSESDVDDLPRRFLNMQKGNRAAAKSAFKSYLAWREDNKVDTILARPHPKFNQCKSVLPHYFAGRDIVGNPIFVQRPGGIDFALARKNNVTMEDILLHQVYVLEYCWNIYEPKTTPSDGLMTSVLDLEGVGWKTLQDKEIMTFVRRFVKMMSDNYPQRSYRTLIINAPRWFGGLYRLFKPLLRESTKRKIEIHTSGTKQDHALAKILGPSLPRELLGAKSLKSGMDVGPGPDSSVELELKSHCRKMLEEAGVEMRSVVR